MMTSLISIIVPVYNTSAYLQKCLDSILNQSYPNIEIIVVNDGSTDDSAALCDDYAKKNPNKLRTFHIPNSGVCHARNLGIELSQGEYICFVDSDDWVAPDFVETLLKTVTAYDASLACVAFSYDNTSDAIAPIEKSSDIEHVVYYEGEDMYGAILKSTDIGGYLCNKIFKKNLITKFLNESIAQCEDFLFVSEYLVNSERLVTLNLPLYHYRRDITKESNVNITQRIATLPIAYEEILKVYTSSAPSYSEQVRCNLLKIYLNFYSRCKVLPKENGKYIGIVKNGIATHWKKVMHSTISLSVKLNLIFTLLFPILSWKIKNQILKRERNIGIWR